MKTYYLVAEKSFVSGNHYTVSVRDNPKGAEVLKEFQAKSYSDAVKMFNFTASNMGHSVSCGVAIDGKPYTFETSD